VAVLATSNPGDEPGILPQPIAFRYLNDTNAQFLHWRQLAGATDLGASYDTPDAFADAFSGLAAESLPYMDDDDAIVHPYLAAA
jgi:hypothetical protein